MTVTSSHVVKTLIGYLHRYPVEATVLLPLYGAIRDHVRRDHCPHGERCPVVTAGAVVVDERHRVLTLPYDDGWGFTEGLPDLADTTLRETALRVLRESTGVHEVWTDPIAQGPMIIDVGPADPEKPGPRLRYGFRYYVRAHSSAVSRAPDGARWAPLAALGTPLHQRIRAHLELRP
jgi:ADP-ribose pyrophosphatase YjhB (NUDIX family)